MSDHPILFSAPMIRALLEGRKTQTRRVYKGRNAFWKGDRLWVREMFSYDSLDVDHDGLMPAWFWADGHPGYGDWTRPKPSIHMPRTYSRITLTVTQVMVNIPLHSISEEDARAEGVEVVDGIFKSYVLSHGYFETAIPSFASLWDSIHGLDGLDSWEGNPWISAYTFIVEKGNIDEVR